MEEEYFRREFTISGRGYIAFVTFFLIFIMVILIGIVEFDEPDFTNRVFLITMWIVGFGCLDLGIYSLFKRILTINETRIKISIGGFWSDSILWEDVTEIDKNYAYRLPEELIAITFKGKTARNGSRIWVSYFEGGFNPKKMAKIDKVIDKHLKNHPEIEIKKTHNQDRKDYSRRKVETSSPPWEIKNILRDSYPQTVEKDNKMIIYKSPWVSTVIKFKTLENGNTQAKTYWDIPPRTFWVLYLSVFGGFIFLAFLFYRGKAKRFMNDINWKIKLYGR